MGAQNQFRAQTASSAGGVANNEYRPTVSQAQGNIQGIQDQQGGLAKALLAQAAGNGPAQGLVQGQLANATNDAIRQSAGVVAGTKGISPGLAARLAGETAGNMTQNAANQSSMNQANIAMQSQNAAGNVLGQQGSQNLEAMTGAGGLQNSQNANNISDFQTTQGVNAGIAKQNQDSTNGLIGGIGKGIAGGIGMLLSHGGEIPTHQKLLNAWAAAKKVQKFAEGGLAALPLESVLRTAQGGAGVDPSQGAYEAGASLGAALRKPKSLDTSDYQAAGVTNPNLPPTHLSPDVLNAAGMRDIGGAPAGVLTAPTLGAQYAPSAGPSLMKAFFDGGDAQDFRPGGNVPGEAKVSGNSPENDTVPAMLSPKEIVLPRSVTMAPDAAERAKSFVQALKEKDAKSVRNSAVPQKEGYARVLQTHKELKSKMGDLEKAIKGVKNG